MGLNLGFSNFLLIGTYFYLLRMDFVKASLGPAGVNLLSDECLSVYLDEFDILNPDCFKERFFINKKYLI